MELNELKRQIYNLMFRQDFNNMRPEEISYNKRRVDELLKQLPDHSYKDLMEAIYLDLLGRNITASHIRMILSEQYINDIMIQGHEVWKEGREHLEMLWPTSEKVR